MNKKGSCPEQGQMNQGWSVASFWDEGGVGHHGGDLSGCSGGSRVRQSGVCRPGWGTWTWPTQITESPQHSQVVPGEYVVHTNFSPPSYLLPYLVWQTCQGWCPLALSSLWWGPSLGLMSAITCFPKTLLCFERAQPWFDCVENRSHLSFIILSDFQSPSDGALVSWGDPFLCEGDGYAGFHGSQTHAWPLYRLRNFASSHITDDRPPPHFILEIETAFLRRLTIFPPLSLSHPPSLPPSLIFGFVSCGKWKWLYLQTVVGDLRCWMKCWLCQVELARLREDWYLISCFSVFCVFLMLGALLNLRSFGCCSLPKAPWIVSRASWCREMCRDSAVETDFWYILEINKIFGGAWVAQSVKHLTLDFGSGHDLRVMRLSPSLGSTLGMESAYIIFPLLPSPTSKK